MMQMAMPRGAPRYVISMGSCARLGRHIHQFDGQPTSTLTIVVTSPCQTYDGGTSAVVT